MAFNSWAEFMAMGTHGVYVWSSYGLTFVAIISLFWLIQRERQQFFREQQQQAKRDAQRVNALKTPNS
ncbi:heme exporter protein CcmD [Agitococcus lubricus]|uniref:Heme exporter protein D n=1 Tax=Agitococcus lubricus TaxID=1077255 RepID=A0A2T5IZH2_9GAMM|nr:heme exporter protein CcmD [Agitococcus lubricus]PTQ89410.1 heme exporter protein D [Agitococcus lubricus]